MINTQDEKFANKDFQNINKELTIVKSVQGFRQLKHNLYKWSLVLSLINKLLLIFSSFFLFVSIIEALIKAPPFLASVSAIGLTPD